MITVASTASSFSWTSILICGTPTTVQSCSLFQILLNEIAKGPGMPNVQPVWWPALQPGTSIKKAMSQMEVDARSSQKAGRGEALNSNWQAFYFLIQLRNSVSSGASSQSVENFIILLLNLYWLKKGKWPERAGHWPMLCAIKFSLLLPVLCLPI